MLKSQHSSPAQVLAVTKSVVCQVSQNGNQANSRFSSYSLFARSGVPVFKYCGSEPSQVSVNLPGQFRSPENILAWANDVVGGNDEELPFQGPNRTRLSIAKTPGYPIFLASPPPITLLPLSSFLPFPHLLSPGYVISSLLGHPLCLNTKISNVNTFKRHIFPDPNTELTTLLFPFASLQLPTGANRQKPQYSPDPPPRFAVYSTSSAVHQLH